MEPRYSSIILAETVAHTRPALETNHTPRNARIEGAIRMIIISWFTGGDEQRAMLRPDDSATFGRSEHRTDYAVVTDACISGLHFRLQCERNQALLIDLGSTNGTFLNGDMIVKSQLLDGDQIIAGMTVFNIRVSLL